MEIYVTSDHHFGHANIIDYCDRPFINTSHMNEFMVDAWNRTIEPDDAVFHLGDFSFGLNEEELTALVAQLNGKIVLVRGNHDRMGKEKLLRCGFNSVYNEVEVQNFLLTHRPVPLERLESYEVPKFNIHGHVHNNKPAFHSSKYVNVSVEVWNYNPIPILDIFDNFV